MDAILARHTGRCGICRKRIVPGRDAIVKVEGAWTHERCLLDEYALEHDRTEAKSDEHETSGVGWPK